MAEWNKNKVEPSAINNGQEFKLKDNLAVDELNAIVNNSFYASDKAKRAEELAESVVKGNGTNVTIDGKIQGEWSADFAESERQKSKNLFDVKNGLDITQKGLQVSISNNITTVSGTVTGNTAVGIYNSVTKLYKDKTYTISFQDYSNLSNFKIAVTGTRPDGTKKYDMLNIDSSKVVNTITCDDDYSLAVEVYCLANATPTGSFKLQIEEGTVATDYQPYNGAIVHTKELNNVRDNAIKRLSYDNYIDIQSSTLTTIGEYFNLFNLDKNAIYKCDLSSSGSNFQNLVGAPDSENYWICYIRDFVEGSQGSVNLYGAYELNAQNAFTGEIRKGYITRLYDAGNYTIRFSGWL